MMYFYIDIILNNFKLQLIEKVIFNFSINFEYFFYYFNSKNYI